MAKRNELYEYIVTNPDGSKRSIWLGGRNEWLINELLAAGVKGVTPIDNPAPRIGAYRWNLVHEYGLDIETVHEAHGGDFPGSHARYVLRSRVKKAQLEEAA